MQFFLIIKNATIKLFNSKDKDIILNSYRECSRIYIVLVLLSKFFERETFHKNHKKISKTLDCNML